MQNSSGDAVIGGWRGAPDLLLPTGEPLPSPLSPMRTSTPFAKRTWALQNRRDRMSKNPIDRFRKSVNTNAGFVGWAALLISIVEKHRSATGGVSGVDVPPTVADQEAVWKRDFKSGRGVKQQAGLRLTAGAVVRIVVVADKEAVEWEHCSKCSVNLFDGFPGGGAAGDIGLIGNDNQQESAIVQAGKGLVRTCDELELIGRLRRVWFAAANDRFVDHSVAVEEDRLARHQRTDSHFVSACLRAGWETSMCQTTAWNASA